MEEFKGLYITETPDAILFVLEDYYDSALNYNEDDAEWLPKSQIRYDEDVDYERGDFIEISMPEWLAEAKGFL